MLTEDIIDYMPNRIEKPILEIRAEYEAEEARKKTKLEERQLVIDETLKQYEQQKE